MTTADLPNPATRYSTIASWVAQILMVLMIGQTLPFKYTYHPETEYIFKDIGGRPAATTVAVAETIAVVLLLIPKTAVYGAILSLGVISGAIFTHLTKLGITVVKGDGSSDYGILFAQAVVIALLAITVIVLRWRELPWIGSMFTKSS